tara:strand:+ start:4201 stop:4431 length:231 start_codon:yes stop_codon:yes gene_type:complete
MSWEKILKEITRGKSSFDNLMEALHDELKTPPNLDDEGYEILEASLLKVFRKLQQMKEDIEKEAAGTLGDDPIIEM